MRYQESEFIGRVGAQVKLPTHNKDHRTKRNQARVSPEVPPEPRTVLPVQK
ncbi:MAG: hypothetical protein ACP5OE_07625 [Thermodesulfobium sp.]